MLAHLKIPACEKGRGKEDNAKEEEKDNNGKKRKKYLHVKKAAARRMTPKRRPKMSPRIPPRPIFAVGGGAVTQGRHGTRTRDKIWTP